MKIIVFKNPDTDYQKGFKISKHTLNDVKVCQSTINALKRAFAISQTTLKWIEDGVMYRKGDDLVIIEGYDLNHETYKMSKYIDYLYESATYEIVDTGEFVPNNKSKPFNWNQKYCYNMTALKSYLEKKDTNYTKISKKIRPNNTESYVRSVVSNSTFIRDYKLAKDIADELDVPLIAIIKKYEEDK